MEVDRRPLDPVRELTRRALAKLGYAIVEASSGEEAAAIMDARTKPIDLLLTDTIMS